MFYSLISATALFVLNYHIPNALVVEVAVALVGLMTVVPSTLVCSTPNKNKWPHPLSPRASIITILLQYFSESPDKKPGLMYTYKNVRTQYNVTID